ncbi:MAG: aspartate aminotransferase family protein [Clostridia bacterium]|jgi:acetylornithine/N-succinyldiaminopimelate aminotransferase|nr:aspartate aminotransferase family protein [Clostridia bacterium]MBT7123485.1 aspartate aminotransferase family protein [Clostridia bacterium]
MLSDITKLDEKYFMQVFGKRLPVCFTIGEDVYLFDTDGKKYTDFLSGIAVNCLGYSDNGFKTALKNTIDNLMHTSNYFYIEQQAKLAEALCNATGMDNVFFQNSGAEAVEGALKLARKYHYNNGDQRQEIITIKGSFHGRTLATLAATGQDKFHEAFKPLIDTFTYVAPNDINELANTITNATAAVMIEPIIGEGGLISISNEYFQAVRALCDKHGALMIADEIQTGCGRTGEFLASPSLGAMPDVVVLAKSLGNGFPIGAFLARGKASTALLQGDHGSTFGGNHLACTAAYYVVNKLITTDMMSQVAQTGAYFKQQLNDLKQVFSCIQQVRGKGLMLGIDLDETVEAKSVLKKLLGMGFVTATAGENVLRFLPPYTIQTQHIDKLIAALKQVL